MLNRKTALLLLCFFNGFILNVFSMGNTNSIKNNNNIYETAFIYIFNHNVSELKTDAKCYYLSVSKISERKDPSEELLKKFKNYNPPVKKVSDSMIAQGLSKDWKRGQKTNFVKDKITGELGIIFFISEIKWISDKEVEVTGGYFEHALSGSTNLYKIIRKDGNWIVKEEKAINVS